MEIANSSDLRETDTVEQCPGAETRFSPAAARGCFARRRRREGLPGRGGSRC